MPLQPDGPSLGARRAPQATAPWLVRLPAPLTFAATFALAAALQYAWGLPLPPPPLLAAGDVAGAVLANAALLLTLYCVALFGLARTTLMPGARSARLVVRGPYRISRNPLYLSLVLAYVGFAGMYEFPWALLLLPLPVALLQRVTIPFEESRMAAVFGEDYARYRLRVRRWI